VTIRSKKLLIINSVKQSRLEGSMTGCWLADLSIQLATWNKKIVWRSRAGNRRTRPARKHQKGHLLIIFCITQSKIEPIVIVFSTLNPENIWLWLLFTCLRHLQSVTTLLCEMQNAFTFFRVIWLSVKIKQLCKTAGFYVIQKHEFQTTIALPIGVINKPTTVELCISPVYRRLAVAKFSKSTM